MTTKYSAKVAALALTIALAASAGTARAQVRDGDVITPANASKVQTLVSPGNLVLVEHGMKITIEPAEHLEWPPPYKDATEKYSSQAALTREGNLGTYLAGLPFPLVDANDPQAATKIMWNFQFRPSSTDDLDARNIEVISRAAGSSKEIEHFTFGHLGFYNSVGRTEVSPTPIDADLLNMGIAARGGVYPVLEPAEMRWAGIIRERSVLPNVEDYALGIQLCEQTSQASGGFRTFGLVRRRLYKLRRHPIRRGRDDLYIDARSKLGVWLFRKNYRVQLPVPW